MQRRCRGGRTGRGSSARHSLPGRADAGGGRVRGAPADGTDVGPLGDLGFTIGNYVFTAPGTVSNGKYLTIWRESPNGTWRFVQDGGSVSPSSSADPRRACVV